MIKRIALCLLLVMSLAVHGARAQEQGTIYLTAGVGLPTQQSVPIGSSTFSTAPAGAIFGGAIGAGVFVSRLASIEGELSRTRLIESQQNVRDFIMSERRRDNVITMLLRFHPQHGRRVQVEPVAGFAIAIPQSSYQTTGSDGKAQPKVDRQMPILVGLTMGVDARVGNERLSIVPSLRLRVTSGNPDEMIPKGYPRWTITPGVAARIGVARARERRGLPKPTYLMGAAGFSVNPAYTGVNGAGDLTSPSGRTSAMMAGGGIFLTRRVAFDLGFARAGVLKTRQGIRYGITINDELRKNFLTAGVRFRIPVARFVHAEPVTAFLLTLHEEVSQQECCRGGYPGQPYTVSPRLRNDFPLSPGFASGIDVPIGNERVAFVPSLRVFFTHNNFASYNGLYARLTWVPSFGMRFGF
jgi:hypothetical protein